MAQRGGLPPNQAGAYTVQNPFLKGVYIFSIANVSGVTTPNTFITLFNPANSGKTMLLGGAFVSTVNSASSSATAPMRGYRIFAAPTGGTVQTTTGGSSVVGKFSSIYPDTGMEVRTGNPSVTLGPALWNTPPQVTNGVGGGAFVHIIDVPPGAGSFSCAPGEGVAVNNAGGTTGQVWNISIAWAEI